MRLELHSFKGFVPPRDFRLCPVMAGRSNTARQPVAQKTQFPFAAWVECTFLTYAGQAILVFRAGLLSPFNRARRRDYASYRRLSGFSSEGRPTAARGQGHWYCVTILPPKFIE
jgi:hypothetical protein